MARPLAPLLILCLSGLVVLSAPGPATPASRKLAAPRAMLVAAKSLPPAPTAAADGTPIIAASGAILVDADSGEVLWSRNADTRLPVASTTKLMTALLICERAADRLDEQAVVSSNAAATGGSSVFGKGDRVTLRDLLRSALICSSNEATVAAAEAVAGSKEAFVGWMNARAQELGCTNTHFVDPHGLSNKHRDSGHYSTARDLALIARAAREQPLVREYVRLRFFKCVSSPRGQIGPRPNRNKLLGKPLPGAPGAVVDGMKTGYTRLAGDCLVSSATRGDLSLIAVVLNSPRLFDETAVILSYGFSRYEGRRVTPEEAVLDQTVLGGATRTVRIAPETALTALVKRGGEADSTLEVKFRGDVLRAPLTRGQVVGAIDLERDGVRVASAPAVVVADVPVSPWLRFLRGAGIAALAVVALMVIGWVYGATAKAARRRRRQFSTRGRGIDPRGTGLG